MGFKKDLGELLIIGGLSSALFFLGHQISNYETSKAFSKALIQERNYIQKCSENKTCMNYKEKFYDCQRGAWKLTLGSGLSFGIAGLGIYLFNKNKKSKKS